MTDKLIEKCRNILIPQIDWACKEGITDALLDAIIRDEIIPIISAEAR